MTAQTQHHESFTIERTYPKCRAHVWSAFALKSKKAAWLGGGLSEMDFRPGGLERASFENEMGRHVNEGHYFEILPERRIVMAYSMAVNGRVHTVSLATILFADENGGTRLTYTEQMCVIPPSDGVEGRRNGWQALLDAVEGVLDADVARP